MRNILKQLQAGNGDKKKYAPFEMFFINPVVKPFTQHGPDNDNRQEGQGRQPQLFSENPQGGKHCYFSYINPDKDQHQSPYKHLLGQSPSNICRDEDTA